MNLILFDDYRHENLKPLTWTRPVCELRCGILTLREKWEKRLNTGASFLTLSYLNAKYPCKSGQINLLVNGGAMPSDELMVQIEALKTGQILLESNSTVVAALISAEMLDELKKDFLPEKMIYLAGKLEQIFTKHPVDFLTTCPDIFAKNEIELEKDFNLITANRVSANVDNMNTIIGDRLFIEEGAVIQCATINTKTGPVYIGKNAEIMEGSHIRGPLALCDGAILKLGTKIYGATTIGPECRVGGEVNNSVLLGYSNKGHDGFLGNSVLGEWCNLGADTNTSNLKNNYGEVKVWSYPAAGFVNSGRQFVGLCMGDHSKCGINTMFNTGTTAGVFANIFGSEFPPKFIPSFAWGNGPFDVYELNKALDVARNVMIRRNITLTPFDEAILSEVFKESAKYRN
jgi:UDP-N-acetylglucosamine diphosphorylase/glucosamine-1-phosphate N-acetyltransferase